MPSHRIAIFSLSSHSLPLRFVSETFHLPFDTDTKHYHIIQYTRQIHRHLLLAVVYKVLRLYKYMRLSVLFLDAIKIYLQYTKSSGIDATWFTSCSYKNVFCFIDLRLCWCILLCFCIYVRLLASLYTAVDQNRQRISTVLVNRTIHLLFFVFLCVQIRSLSVLLLLLVYFLSCSFQLCFFSIYPMSWLYYV